MKYIVKTTGEEVRIGDVIVKQKSSRKDGLIVETTTTFLVTEETLPALIKKGIVVQKEEKIPPTHNITLEAVFAHFANRNGINVDNAKELFKLLKKVAPSARFRILLKEVALMMDEDYKDHILERECVYAWNIVSEPKLVRIPTKVIKSKEAAFFRDAKEVVAAVKLINGK